MPIKIKCPNQACGKTLSFPDTMAGRSISCPACQHPAQIGRFQIRAQLGAGAFGAVYRAFDPQLEREVALKVPRAETLQDAEAKARFQREAKAAAKLHHPHIVPVHEVGQDGDKCFIVSALILGQSLASLIPPGGAEAREAAHLIVQLAEALAYAHKHGVLHRDVKPANALVTDEGMLFLTDFGLAGWVDKDESRLTHSGAIMGTPAYMPPEQASGDTQHVGPASDQYSAGATLYHLLTGRYPFTGPAAQVLHDILRQPPMPLSQCRPDVDPGLEAICLKAMAKDPGQRYPDCQAFAAELRQWLANHSPTTDSPGRSRWAALPQTVPGPSAPRGTSSAPVPTYSPPPIPETARLASVANRRAVYAGIGLLVGIALLAVLGAVWFMQPPTSPDHGAPIAGEVPAADPAGATADNATLPPRGDEGFVPLFNGKDLAGWLVDGSDGQDWGVADREVIGWGKQGNTRSYLLTKRPYSNFRLRFEFNLSQGAIGAIAVRALRGEKLPLNGQSIVDHPLFKLLDGKRPGEETGTIHWILNTAFVAPGLSADLKPVGSWNRAEIEVKGHSIRGWINDKEVVNAGLTADARLADGGIPALNRPKGRVGFQKHTGTVRFRNIEIKELSPGSPDAVTSAPGAKNGFALSIPEKDRGKWRIADGCLEQIALMENLHIDFGDTNWSDYDFEIEFCRVRGNDQIAIAFLTDREKKQGCLYGLASYGNTAHTLEACANGKPWKVYAQKKGAIPGGVWHRARVSVRHGRAQCFLGDQKLFDHTIDTHSTGCVGLRTWNSYYRFRNIKVTDPAGKVLLEGLPDLESAWSAKGIATE